jgi:hypothetical protein
MTRSVRLSRIGGLRRCEVVTDQITDHSRTTEACPNFGLRPDPLVEFPNERPGQPKSYLLGFVFHIVLMSYDCTTPQMRHSTIHCYFL